jgi:hypothetical protein
VSFEPLFQSTLTSTQLEGFFNLISLDHLTKLSRMGLRKTSPGELIYLSERKLEALAPQLGIKATSLRPKSATGEARMGLEVPNLAGVNLGARIEGEPFDPGFRQRFTWKTLQRAEKRMGSIPSLENGDLIQEGNWFYLRRRVKVGVGHCDSMPSIRALVVVDSEPVSAGTTPGLLLNGSILHVLDPYASDTLRTTTGDRSGSGTDRLFNWLEEVRRSWEEEPQANLRQVVKRIGLAPRGTETALSMYDLFAREEWLAPYFAEPLMHGMFCEGIAQASLVCIGEDRAVVMGSPLFLRRCSPATDDNREGFISRLLGRRVV